MLSQKLFEENMDIAKSCLNHPFLQGIASGKLPQKNFVYYMAQDAFYLDCYAKAFALGIAKSPDKDARSQFKTLLDGTFDELNLHGSYSDKLGFSLDVSPAEATLKYTDFLIRVASLEDIGYLAAATSPCGILYEYLGCELAKDYNPDTTYKDWILTYSSDEFKDGTKMLDSIIDIYGCDNERTRQYYRRAMELEYEFFDEAYRQ